LCLEVGHEPSKILHGALLEAGSFSPFVGEICMESFVSLVNFLLFMLVMEHILKSLVYMPHECHTKQYFLV
jgi:hypothetical protein